MQERFLRTFPFHSFSAELVLKAVYSYCATSAIKLVSNNLIGQHVAILTAISNKKREKLEFAS